MNLACVFRLPVFHWLEPEIMDMKKSREMTWVQWGAVLKGTVLSSFHHMAQMDIEKRHQRSVEKRTDKPVPSSVLDVHLGLRTVNKMTPSTLSKTFDPSEFPE